MHCDWPRVQRARLCQLSTGCSRCNSTVHSVTRSYALKQNGASAETALTAGTLIKELDTGELLFLFQRGGAWASVGSAVAIVAAEEGQRILWQPYGAGNGTAGMRGVSPPRPTAQPATHSGNGSVVCEAAQDVQRQRGKQEQQSQQPQLHAAAAAAAAVDEVSMASNLPQRAGVNQLAASPATGRSDRPSNGAKSSQAIISQEVETGASRAAQVSTPKATDPSVAQPSQSRSSSPALVCAAQASTAEMSQPQPIRSSPSSSALAQAILALPAVPTSLLPAEPSKLPQDDTRSSGASRRDARQASGREFVESIIAGAEATWKEAGLAGSGAAAGTTIIDVKEPCVAAQKAAVAAAKVAANTARQRLDTAKGRLAAMQRREARVPSASASNGASAKAANDARRTVEAMAAVEEASDALREAKRRVSLATTTSTYKRLVTAFTALQTPPLPQGDCAVPAASKHRVHQQRREDAEEGKEVRQQQDQQSPNAAILITPAGSVTSPVLAANGASSVAGRDLLQRLDIKRTQQVPRQQLRQPTNAEQRQDRRHSQPARAAPMRSAGEQAQHRLGSMLALWLALASVQQLAVSLMHARLLVLWRSLPFWLRSRLWRRQPPLPTVHASPSIACMLATSEDSELVRLAAGGFNAKGHTMAPLHDVPRWRFEALVHAPVRRLELYRMALTCPSALSAERRVAQSYERLEFLGDAVLSMVVRLKLLRTFPDQDEGFLSRVHDALVSRRALIPIAQHLGVPRFMVANGRTMLNGAANWERGLSADALEALVGAMHLDRGFEAARQFVEWVLDDAASVGAVHIDGNYKSRLLELVKVNDLKLPRFRAVKVIQQGAEVIWEATVTLDGEEYGWAKDPYKGTAVQRACEQAMQRLEALTGSNNSATSSDDEGFVESLFGSGPAQSSAAAAGGSFNTPSEELSALSQLILQFEADTGLFSKGRTQPKNP